MKVREITMHNFKSIARDCFLRVDKNVTVLVGASQSGKTNILRAIEKFSIGNYQPDDICDFSPAGGGTPPDPNMPMITITFDVEEDDKEALEEISPNLAFIKELKVTRKYNGEYDVDTRGSELTDIEIARLVDIGENMEKLIQELDPFLNKWRDEWEDIDDELSEASQKLSTFKAAIPYTVRIGDRAEWPNLSEALRPVNEAFSSLFKVLVEAKEEPGQETEKTTESGQSDDVEQARQLITNIESLATQHGEVVVPSRDIVPKLTSLLPAFMYVSSEHENLLHGEINLDELESVPEDPKFTSTHHLIKLAGLDLTALPQMGVLQRRNSLRTASRRVTRVLQKIWQQQRIEIEISLTGPNERQLLILVSSDGRPSRFPEHQGSGFRWYLEFYLSYALAAGKELKHDVLLIDEAGIHLHPYAQRNLVERLNEIAEHNQVIHATHLPDMLDLENPERWRVVIHEEGSDAGTQIINEAYQPREENIGFEVVTKALWGSVIVPSITLGPRNFIVEGASDVIYLHTVSRILAKDDLNNALLVTGEVLTFPAHGVHRYPALLTFCNRPGFNTVALFDSDGDGKRMKKKLIEDDMLSPDKAIEINDVYSSSTEERDIESIFGFALLKEAAMHVYKADLPAEFDFRKDDLQDKGGLGKKFKEYFKSQGIEYDTTQVAEAVKKILSREPGKLTENSRERFAALLGKIRDAFQDQVLSDIKTEVSPK